MTIRSQSGLRLAWVFAILWNLIAAPATFLGAVPAIQKGNTVAWVVLIFPFVGAWLMIWAVHLTLRWRRFGTSQLDLSGDTVALGGSLLGTISARNLPEDAAPRLTSSCINRVVSGSGNNRSTWEKILWQEEQNIPREALLAVTGRILGLSRSRSIPRGDVRDITLSVGMQAGATPYYDLVISRAAGPTARVTAALRNKREAEWLAGEIKKALV